MAALKTAKTAADAIANVFEVCQDDHIHTPIIQIILKRIYHATAHRLCLAGRIGSHGCGPDRLLSRYRDAVTQPPDRAGNVLWRARRDVAARGLRHRAVVRSKINLSWLKHHFRSERR